MIAVRDSPVKSHKREKEITIVVVAHRNILKWTGLFLFLLERDMLMNYLLISHQVCFQNPLLPFLSWLFVVASLSQALVVKYVLWLDLLLVNSSFSPPSTCLSSVLCSIGDHLLENLSLPFDFTLPVALPTFESEKDRWRWGKRSLIILFKLSSFCSTLSFSLPAQEA